MTLEIAAVVSLFFAGLVKGATGIGFATLALPLLTQLIGLKAAMAVVIMPTLAVNAGVALWGGYFWKNARELAPLYFAMIPGVGAGALLLSSIETHAASAALGVFILIYVGLAFIRPSARLPEIQARRLRFPVGFVSGMVTGVTGSQIFPFVPYMMAVQRETEQTVQAVNIGVLILSTAMGLSLVAAQTVDPILLIYSAVGIVPTLVGSAFGVLVRSAIGGERLRSLVFVILALSGAKLALG